MPMCGLSIIGFVFIERLKVLTVYSYTVVMPAGHGVSGHEYILHVLD